MEDKHRKQLLEEYEEAALRLWMDEYTEMEGERLWKEYQEAEENGEVPEIPGELDKKCKQLIHSSLKKKKRKQALAQFMRSASRIAACLCIILVCSSAAVLSVEAFRIPVINFFLRLENRYTSLSFSDPIVDAESRADELKQLSGVAIPSGYKLFKQDVYESGSIFLFYLNENNENISILVNPAEGSFNYDTENATQTEMELCGHEAFFVEKEGFRVIWLNAEEDMIYELFADGLDINSFWKLAFLLAE